MGIPLEVAIGRQTGYPLHFQNNRMPLYREDPETFDVCPHCKRQAIPYWDHGDGYVFPGDWQCPEHGSVTPMKSAVANTHPYVPDWSAA